MPNQFNSSHHQHCSNLNYPFEPLPNLIHHRSYEIGLPDHGTQQAAVGVSRQPASKRRQPRACAVVHGPAGDHAGVQRPSAELWAASRSGVCELPAQGSDKLASRKCPWTRGSSSHWRRRPDQVSRQSPPQVRVEKGEKRISHLLGAGYELGWRTFFTDELSKSI